MRGRLEFGTGVTFISSPAALGRKLARARSLRENIRENSPVEGVASEGGVVGMIHGWIRPCCRGSCTKVLLQIEASRLQAKQIVPVNNESTPRREQLRAAEKDKFLGRRLAGARFQLETNTFHNYKTYENVPRSWLSI